MAQPTGRQAEYIRQLPLHHGVGTKAAIAAGYSERSAHVASSRLLKNDNVVKALEKQSLSLQRDYRAELDRVIKELWDTYRTTTDNQAYAVAVRCLELLGKQAGGFQEKLQVEHTVQESPYAGLSTEQLRALIQVTDQMTPDQIQAMVDNQLGIIEGHSKPV
jgi:phage terminase small subunit